MNDSNKGMGKAVHVGVPEWFANLDLNLVNLSYPEGAPKIATTVSLKLTIAT